MASGLILMFGRIAPAGPPAALPAPAMPNRPDGALYEPPTPCDSLPPEASANRLSKLDCPGAVVEDCVPGCVADCAAASIAAVPVRPLLAAIAPPPGTS